MPPWNVEPSLCHFASNAAVCRDEGEATSLRLGEHVRSAGRAEANFPLLREFTDGWRLSREPDQVVAMSEKPIQVPAEGLVDYQYFVVDPGLPKISTFPPRMSCRAIRRLSTM